MRKHFSIGVKYKSWDNAIYNTGEPIRHGQALVKNEKVVFNYKQKDLTEKMSN